MLSSLLVASLLFCLDKQGNRGNNSQREEVSILSYHSGNINNGTESSPPIKSQSLQLKKATSVRGTDVNNSI